jgi:hypothetical protein
MKERSAPGHEVLWFAKVLCRKGEKVTTSLNGAFEKCIGKVPEKSF